MGKVIHYPNSLRQVITFIDSTQSQLGHQWTQIYSADLIHRYICYAHYGMVNTAINNNRRSPYLFSFSSNCLYVAKS